MPGFNIYGNNNRAAGRDYHEHAAPDVCPCCETRLLSDGREWCRHCEHEYNEAQRIEFVRQLTEKRLGYLLAIVFSLFMVAATSLSYVPDSWRGYSLAAIFLCFFACGSVIKALEMYSKKNYYAE